jgi:hypothetical protein
MRAALPSPRPSPLNPLPPPPPAQVSSAYSAGPQHQLFSLSLNSIYRQDATSAASDFMRVEGVPVRLPGAGGCCSIGLAGSPAGPHIPAHPCARAGRTALLLACP